jgi:hypothetical protein
MGIGRQSLISHELLNFPSKKTRSFSRAQLDPKLVCFQLHPHFTSFLSASRKHFPSRRATSLVKLEVSSTKEQNHSWRSPQFIASGMGLSEMTLNTSVPADPISFDRYSPLEYLRAHEIESWTRLSKIRLTIERKYYESGYRFEKAA